LRVNAWLLAAAILASGGCGSEDLNTVYGKRRGAEGGASINGTGVLAGMFGQAGHKVATRTYLSPRMREYDVIVWFPDDFQPPKTKQQDFLEDWLGDRSGRTLIYVGRDYDASPEYWDKVLPGAPADQSVEMLRRKALAQSEYDRRRSATPASESCRWFHISRDHPTTHVGQRRPGPAPLTGAWCAGGDVDPQRVDIRVRARLEEAKEPPKNAPSAAPSPASQPAIKSGDKSDEEETPSYRAELGNYRSQVLLASDDVVLAREVTNAYWPSSKIIVITNGSFLLNLPLVEREHRKLAGKLIGACGPAKKVAFLESDEDGLMVYDKEPGEDSPTGFEAFTVWPLGAILMHFVILGVVLLAGLMMIFGRPHELPRPPVSDFGHHIEALGDLLARTQDQRYAEQRLAAYHEKVKRDTGGGAKASTIPVRRG
jgi:hypothetical protein